MNTWLVPYKPGRLEAIGYKNGKVVSRAKVETTKESVRVKLTPYRNSLVGDGRDAMPITVEMVDSKGRHVPTANNMIEFSIDGPAKIIGLGNGNPNCHEPEKGNKRSLFNGLAQVIIQTEEGLGEVTLTATAPGIKPANLTIPVNQVELAPFVAVEKPIMILDKWLASPFSKDRPDVNRRIADNDMNTWEAMAASSAMFLENASYVVCHTEFTLPEDYRKDGGVIQFKNLAGKAEVWLNGKLIGSKDMVDERNFQVEFPATEGKCELRVLLNSSPNTHVGLKGSVTVQGK